MNTAAQEVQPVDPTTEIGVAQESRHRVVAARSVEGPLVRTGEALNFWRGDDALFYD